MSKRTQNPKPRKRRGNPEPVIDAVAPEAVAPAPAVEVAPAPAPLPNPEPELAEVPKKNPRRRSKRRKHAGKRRGKKKGRRNNPIGTWAKVAMITGAVVVTGALGYGIFGRSAAAKSKAGKCGEKYRELVVTTSGLTLEDPGSDLPFLGQSNYNEWYELAENLVQQARDRFDDLGEIEKQANSDSDYPRWNALVALKNRMVSRAEALSSPSLTFNYAGARAEAQTVIFDAICLMERADEGIAEYGGAPAVTPSVTGESGEVPAWKWFAIGGGVALALGGVGYALSRKSSSSAAIARPSLPTARASRPE